MQLTPPGLECSIQIGTGITRVKPGTYQGMYLIVSDIEATRAELVDRGVDVSEPFHFEPKGRTPALIPGRPTTTVSPRSVRWTVPEMASTDAREVAASVVDLGILLHP